MTPESNEDEEEDDVSEDKHGVIAREEEDDDDNDDSDWDWEWEGSSPGLARPPISKSI